MINYKKRQSAVWQQFRLTLLSGFIASAAIVNVCRASAKPLNNIATRIADTTKNDTVYTRVDKYPSYPGGGEAYIKFLTKNMKYPDVMRDRKIEEENITVQFIVEPDGSLSHIKALSNPGYGFAEEAVRLIKLSPKWTPGYKNNQPVRVAYKVPVSFKLKTIQKKDEESGLRVTGG